jgi:hypothetical protein
MKKLLPYARFVKLRMTQLDIFCYIASLVGGFGWKWRMVHELLTTFLYVVSWSFGIKETKLSLHKNGWCKKIESDSRNALVHQIWDFSVTNWKTWCRWDHKGSIFDADWDVLLVVAMQAIKFFMKSCTGFWWLVDLFAAMSR